MGATPTLGNSTKEKSNTKKLIDQRVLFRTLFFIRIMTQLDTSTLPLTLINPDQDQSIVRLSIAFPRPFRRFTF